LLFQAKLSGHSVRVYCLFEHQTREDSTIALRLLRYMVRIWESVLKACPQESLPVILPVVLAQNERSWQTRPEFSALFDLPTELASELGSYLPDFMFRLIQLAELPFDAIGGIPSGIMTLRVMKAERANALLSDAVWEESCLDQLPLEIFEMLLRYIMNADIDTEAVERQVNHIQSPKLKQTAMTLAQKLHQEGHQEGRQEGRLQTLRDNVIEALEIRYAAVPAGLREEIESIAEEARLHHLLRAAIQCPTLESFADAV